MRKLLVIFMALCCVLYSEDAEAQRNRYKKRKKTSRSVSRYRGSSSRGSSGRFKSYTFVGANLNAVNYFGDLAPINRRFSTDITFTRPGMGVYLGQKLNHSIAVRGALNWYRIFGDDIEANTTNDENAAARYARNLSFRNDIYEASLGLEIYFLPNYGGFQQRPPFNAFLFIGASVFSHTPMGKVPELDYQSDLNGSVAAPQAGSWVNLRELGTEGQNMGVVEPYGTISYSVPVTLGIQIAIPRTNVNFGLEMGIRYLFTDYIDDVSTNYVGLDQFDANGDGVWSEEETLARIMSDRSAELIGVNSEEVRSLDGGDLLIRNNGTGFNASGYLGGGIDGVKRGSPEQNDMIFTTQIKIQYFIRTQRRSRAKFR